MKCVEYTWCNWYSKIKLFCYTVRSDITMKTMIFGLILLAIICHVSSKTSSEREHSSAKAPKVIEDYFSLTNYDKNENSEESSDRIQKRIRTNQGFWCLWCDLFFRKKKKAPTRTRKPQKVRTTTGAATTVTP